MRVPWLLKADDIAPAEINDFTENVDVFSSIIKICNLNKNGNLNSKFKNHFTGENNTDSILPNIFGGSKKEILYSCNQFTIEIHILRKF